MIKLNIEDYCNYCEAFEPDVKKVNHDDIDVICKKRIWCRNAIKLYERLNQACVKEEKNDD